MATSSQIISLSSIFHNTDGNHDDDEHGGDEHQNSAGRLTAKVIDFGFSCFGLSQEDIVQLPLSWPWYAPERKINYRFTLKDAKCTDVYSFGIVCLYVLFWNRFSEDCAGTPQKRDGESRLCQWKDSSEGILSKAEEHLDKTVDELLPKTSASNESLKQSLRAFFQATLHDEPDSRNTDFQTLINFLS